MTLDDGPLDPSNHLGYLVNHASDLTKLVKHIVQSGKVDNKAIREALLTIHKEAHQGDQGNLAGFALTLFEHYVVNESGHCVEYMISFFKSCLMPLMNAEEQRQLFRDILSKFLRVPQKYFSQKAVI